MHNARNRNVRSLVAMMLFAASALLAGCGDAEVPKGDVEKSAMKMLSASVGKEAPPVTCPGNLKAKVGATLTCAMVIDGKTHDVNVHVTSLEGTTANFNVEVADKPRS
jgi:hypothetical protein